MTSAHVSSPFLDPDCPVKPTDLALELVRSANHLERYWSRLVDLATVAWQGEPPALFYSRIGALLGRLPWLVDLWVGPEVVGALLETTISQDAPPIWRELPQSPRGRSRFTQFEGLALLSKLKAPGHGAAHEQLVRVLDAVDAGLTSDRGGTARRAARKHPLTEVFFGLGRPQTMAALTNLLCPVIEETYTLYPRVAEFLEYTSLPLARGGQISWLPPEHVDLLGVDSDPVPNGACRKVIRAPAPANPELRAFAADDLADELIAMIPSLAPHRDEMNRLSRVWRNEGTWDFFESIHRLSHIVRWLRPLLAEHVDLKALQAVGQALHSTKRLYAEPKLLRWRAQNRVAPLEFAPTPPLYAPSSANRRWGIFQLRALLVLGRLRWTADESAEADKALGNLITELRNWLVEDHSDKPGPKSRMHYLEVALDQIGRPETALEAVAAIEGVLPDASVIHPEADRLLREAYLPLLRGEAASWNPSPRPQGEKTRRRTPPVRKIRIPTVRPEECLPGESPDEAAPTSEWLRRPTPTARPTPLRHELRWIHQRIWGKNSLLIRNHIESLSDAEAAEFLRACESAVNEDVNQRRSDEARVGIIAVLTLLTGQGCRTWARADIRDPSVRRSRRRPRLLLQDGIVELPVLRPQNSFKPSEQMAGLLEPTASFLRLDLPPPLRDRITRVLSLGQGPWRWDPDSLRTALQTYVARLGEQVGTGISLARVRNFARARLREFTNDTSMTMLLCGDSFGCSSAPLYYCSFALSDVEDSFRRAMWPLFGNCPKSTPGTRSKVRVGSQLLVTDRTARQLARTPSARIHAPSKSMRGEGAIIDDHNTLTMHLLCMLVAVAGHRPTEALLRLRRFDFDSDLRGAVFADKQCDPAHLSRYVPLADLLSAQVDEYISHLRGAIGSSDQTIPLVKRANAALLGEAPLFFCVGPSGETLELSLATWKEMLPENWLQLPLNWGRTWLASRGRDAGLEADHLAIALGHLEATGYPYSRESPLEPAQLSRTMSAPLGRLARSAGWVLRKGAQKAARPTNLLQETGPLRDWREERQALSDSARAFSLRQRQIQRSTLRSKREAGEGLAFEALKLVCTVDAPSFSELSLRTTRTSGQTDTKRSEPVQLSSEDLERIQTYIDEHAKKDRVLAISAHNALHRYLKMATKHLNWRCPIPAPWLSPPTLEPSPFFSGVFRANAQIRLLREHFGCIATRPPAGSGFSGFEWLCGIASLALCIFSFEQSARRVRNILDSRATAVASSTITDLLLVQTAGRERSIGIRGLAAITLARLKRDYPSDPLPTPERMDEVLFAILPPALAGSPKGLLDRICATTSVANVSELSGLARTAIDERGGSVAMPVARQRQFLEEGLGPIDERPQIEQGLPKARVSEPGKSLSASDSRTQYRKLSRILHIGAGPTTFRLTGETLSQANIGAFRQPLCRELGAFLSQQGLSPVVAAIARFALHLTSNGTPEKKDPAWSTVYGYVTAFGTELVALAGKLDFLRLDSNEYLDLYQNVLDGKLTDISRGLAARQIIAFHCLLQDVYGVDHVDFSDLEGAAFADIHNVDAEVVQPQEFVIGARQLQGAQTPSTAEPASGPTELRLQRQSAVFALLLRASGARHNELTALRFKDVLCNVGAVVLLIRPTRYRRLKTAAARRIVDCSRHLTKAEIRIVDNWLRAERLRLGAKWKPVLPIFGKMEKPDERVPTEDLRDTTLEALNPAIGYRSRIHRVRHLVANERLSAAWLSAMDWRALRLARARSRRLVRARVRALVLPRHIREQTAQFGHRFSSTTVANYFHLPWMALSRPHAALSPYATRHSAATAMGVSTAAADKVVQRTKGTRGSSDSADRLTSWLAHIVKAPPPTPGRRAQTIQQPTVLARQISARLLDRLLRDAQRGVPLAELALSFGLGNEAKDALIAATREVERRTAFAFAPHTHAGRQPRTTRVFADLKPLRRILDLMDEGPEEKQLLIAGVADTYMMWARRSARDSIIWPAREVDRLEKLLVAIGISPSCVVRTDAEGEAGFQLVKVVRKKGAFMNHALAWALVVCRIAATMRGR